MSFKAAKCPGCGGDLQVPDNKDIVKCMYCSADIMVREAILAASTINIETFLTLASKAADAGNHEEAYRYYSTVLENDPACVRAWVGKGEAAAWQSTLGNPRHEEMIAAFDSAISFAPSEATDQLKLECADAVASFISAYYRMAFDHMVEFSKLGDSGGEFVQRCLALAQVAEEGLVYVPDYPPLLKILINIYNRLSCKWYVSADGTPINYLYLDDDGTRANGFKENLQEYIDLMKQVDPAYQPPERPKGIRKAAWYDNCYIATATMGDYDHPYVLELRTFRDEFLMPSILGRAVTSTYYWISPPCADVIAKRAVLRKMSYMLVVRPALALSRLLMRIFRPSATARR